jgi:hypothetical protein
MKADKKSIDSRHHDKLVDTLVRIGDVHASLQGYVPYATFATQYHSSLAESAAAFFYYSHGLTDAQLVDLINKVISICDEDPRIRDGFLDFYGPHISRQDHLEAVELEFGVNAKILMEAVFELK